MAAIDSFENFPLGRALEAKPSKLLSKRNGKVVELVVDEQGEFVRRVYHKEAVNEVVGASRLPFKESWEVYNQMHEDAGVAIVPSALVGESPGGHPVIVARYLGKVGMDVIANIGGRETTLAGSLGRLLTAHDRYLPSPQGYMPDTFAVDPDTQTPVVVDIDPYVTVRDRGFNEELTKTLTEASQAIFIHRIGKNILEWITDGDERAAMAAAFCATAEEVMGDDPSMDLLGSFDYVRQIARGINPEA